MRKISDIKAIILPLIEEALNLSTPITNTQLSFKDDFKADSLDIVSMVMLLEEELDLDIDDNQIDNLKTIDDVIAFIRKIQ